MNNSYDINYTQTLLKQPIECGAQYELCDKEKQIVDIVHWARNLSPGLEYCKKYQFFPGPYGFLDKKNFWHPYPGESCDFESDCHPVVAGKLLWKPFFIRDHSKTKQHITYLLKHRIRTIFNHRFSDTLEKLIRISEKGVLFFVDSEDEIIKRFVSDVLAGKVFEIDKIAF